MRRASLAALALAGCMRIYPDPELPDLTVTWPPDGCRSNVADVGLAAMGDADQLQLAATVPCTDGMTLFHDVHRERYAIDGTLLSPTGAMFTMTSTEVDLRDGLDHEADLYFDTFDNVRVAWVFSQGGTCATVGADVIQISFSDTTPDAFSYSAPCDSSPFYGTVPAGTFSIVVSAQYGGTTLAASQPSLPMDVFENSFTDFGTQEILE